MAVLSKRGDKVSQAFGQPEENFMDVLWLQLTFHDPHIIVHAVINCVNYIGLVSDSL